MNTDSYFEIGHSHKVCEDYALSGTIENIGYAIVSDGCSSSKESDVGARLLAHISRDAIVYLHKRKLLYDMSFLFSDFRTTFEELIIKKCLEVKDTLRFSCDIFDATLLIALGIGTDYKILFAWGDGYFILKKPIGAIEVIHLEYQSGAPYYLSYELSQDKRAAYEQQYGDSSLDRNIDGIELDGSISYIEHSDTRSIMEGSYFRVLKENFDYSQVIVSSDGIGTYEDDPNVQPPTGIKHTKYSALSVIPQIIAYKNPVGEFVTRRMNRLRKEYAETHIIHQDDVSCAAIDFS